VIILQRTIRSGGYRELSQKDWFALSGLGSNAGVGRRKTLSDRAGGLI